MKLATPVEKVPLATDADGVVRVGNTRVTLDTLVAVFSDGATAEEIVQQYPSLDLADVYAVIGYYLHRRDEVETYLRQRRLIGNRVCDANETRFPARGVRARLLARRTA